MRISEDQRNTLLFLTDLSNEAEEEDIIISTWNDSKYGQPSSGYYERFRQKGLKVHDYLYTYPGEGKDYLIDLYKKNYPVIPSVDKVQDLSELPQSADYFIKPKNGFSAIGARKISKQELLDLDPSHYLIQPFIDFEYELSFYYIDKELQYVLYAPDKNQRWDLIPFTPSEEDLIFARTFVQWNPQKYGIERIDACRLRDENLLLVEITDQGGTYLSMPLLPADVRESFLKNLVVSIRRNIFGT